MSIFTKLINNVWPQPPIPTVSTSRVERAVHSALEMTKENLRKDFLTVFEHGVLADKALVSFLYCLATRDHLTPTAAEVWEKFPEKERNATIDAAQAALYIVVGRGDITKPIPEWAVELLGFPTTEKFREKDSGSSSRLRYIATHYEFPGMTGCFARFVYAQLVNADPSYLWRHVTLPPLMWESRDRLIPIWEGYVLAFEKWVDSVVPGRKDVTRKMLFNAMCVLISDIDDCHSTFAKTTAGRLISKLGFSYEELVSTREFTSSIEYHWDCLPTGARMLGAIGSPWSDRLAVQSRVDEWIRGFLSRYHYETPPRLEKEEQSPREEYYIQSQEALLLPCPVESYIAFHKVRNKFKGLTWRDPKDPLSEPVCVIDSFGNDKPLLPSYKQVEAWYEKQQALIARAL